MEVKVGRSNPTQATVQSSVQDEDFESRVVPHEDWGLNRISSRGPTVHKDDNLRRTFRYVSSCRDPPDFDKKASPATRDGRHLMAIGCVEGLWIGDIRDPQCKSSPYVRLVGV